MKYKYTKNNINLKVTFCYKNNKHYYNVLKSLSGCLVIGDKLYVIVNRPFKSEKEGITRTEI